MTSVSAAQRDGHAVVGRRGAVDEDRPLAVAGLGQASDAAFGVAGVGQERRAVAQLHRGVVRQGGLERLDEQGLV